MRILAISEHFLPRIAGTTEYALQTCTALAQAGHEVHLVIPGESNTDKTLEGFPFQVTSLGVGWPAKADPSRTIRYQFCEKVSNFAEVSAKNNQCDVVHILFGLFVSEVIDPVALQAKGVPCLLTVHNVPPQECSRSWRGDSCFRRVKDFLRLKAVTRKNHSRLRRKEFSAYITPSPIVAKLLSSIKSQSQIEVVPHGINQDLCEPGSELLSKKPKPGSPIQILTVGGWMPHKRQHLIPRVAASLREEGIDFIWHLAGPTRRSPEYQGAILREIAELALEDRVKVLGPVSDEELSELYRLANLYVQPSIEEGFCITALNAAGQGIPVVGSPAGALPEICRISGGALVHSKATDISSAISHFIAAELWDEPSASVADRVRNKYTWHNSSKKLVRVYTKLVSDVQLSP